MQNEIELSNKTEQAYSDAPQDESLARRLIDVLHRVKIQQAFQTLYKGRGRPYDDRELDVFECIKTIGFGIGITTYTNQYLIGVSTVNPWMTQDFNQTLSFAMFAGAVVILELFFAISAFFFSYRMF